MGCDYTQRFDLPIPRVYLVTCISIFSTLNLISGPLISDRQQVTNMSFNFHENARKLVASIVCTRPKCNARSDALMHTLTDGRNQNVDVTLPRNVFYCDKDKHFGSLKLQTDYGCRV